MLEKAIVSQTNINGEQKKEIGILSRRLASAKQDFEEQVTTVVTDQLLPFEKERKSHL